VNGVFGLAADVSPAFDAGYGDQAIEGLGSGVSLYSSNEATPRFLSVMIDVTSLGDGGAGLARHRIQGGLGLPFASLDWSPLMVRT
jgi:hypothetical protein